MQTLARLTTILTLMTLAAGCGAKHQVVQLPPRIDLRAHETIGVVQFDSDADGSLAEVATRRFVESARRDQGLVRTVALGPGDRALSDLGSDRWSPDAFVALGRERGLRSVLVGRLSVSDVRPDLRIAATLRSGSLSAQVDATLDVELIEAASGASLWSASSRATRSVGHISVLRGKQFVFDAENPDAAYGELVDHLVEQVARDFHARWERR